MSSEWHQWTEVTQYIYPGHRLFRSSSPNYVEGDHTQRLTPSAISFLLDQGITGIISFNQYPYTDEQIATLHENHIAYLHLPVQDYHAATVMQLMQANDFYRSASHPSVLVHCGYGHGRTGTAITALQLLATNGQNPPESEWQSVNHVENESQMRDSRCGKS